MKLIIINGPPGVGKSTLAKKLHETLPLSFLLEIDAQRRYISHYRERAKESSVLSYTVSEAIIDASLQSGYDVIVDKAISDTETVDRLINVAKKHNSDVYEFVLNGSKEEIVRRAEARGYREGGLLTPEKVVKWWEDTQEYLKKRVEVLEINTDNLNEEEVFHTLLSKI